MVSTVIDGDTHSDHGKTNQGSDFYLFFKTLVAGRDKFSRDRTSDDIIYKFIGFYRVSWKRFNVTANFSELTSSTGLFFMGVIKFTLLSNCFAKCNLGFTSNNFTTILALNTFNINLKVKFAHARNNSLRRLFVSMNPK